MDESIIIVAIDGEHAHRLITACDKRSVMDALQRLGEQASDPEYPLTWYCAAQMSCSLRRQHRAFELTQAKRVE